MPYAQFMFERCLYFNSNALVRKLNRLWDEAYAETGLSAPHAYLLRTVCHQPGLTQQQVADELQLEKSTVTRFVKALLDKGLISRQPGDDGRENLLVATPAGKQICKQANEVGNRLYKKMRQRIGEDAFTSLVSDMRNTLQKIG